MSKAPKGSQKPKLSDDLSVSEVFADEIVGVTMSGDTFVVTFAVNRLVADVPRPDIKRTVVARIALPAQAAAKLTQDITGIINRLNIINSPPKGPAN